jgi:uncharacterized protein
MKTDSRRNYVRNLLLFTLGALALAFLTGSIYIGNLYIEGYLHPPRWTPSHPGALAREITLTTQDDISLAAWYAPPQNGVVILIAHGHGGARNADLFRLFTRLGYGALAWDFRAHGQSGGEFSSLGYLEARDVEAALDYALAQPGVRAVGAYGESMGAGAVIHAAARRSEIGAVVVDSAFTSLDDQLRHTYTGTRWTPFIRLAAQLRTGVRFQQHRPIDSIGEISPRPVFILQGLGDTIVDPASGQALYEAAGEPRQLWAEPNVGHVSLRRTHPQEFEQRIKEFFDQALAGE